MSENSFPDDPRAALKRFFSASVQKSLPRERESVGGESRGREKKGGHIPAQDIPHCCLFPHQVTQHHHALCEVMQLEGC